MPFYTQSGYIYYYKGSAGAILVGSGYLTGYNATGLVGDNTTVNKSSFTQLSGSWTFLNTYGFNSGGVKSDGTLWLWGANDFGQLEPASAMRTMRSWKTVSAGFSHGAAIDSNGSLWTWGGNSYGQLGTLEGFSVVRSSLVQIGSSSWTSVVCGASHTVAITTGNVLFGWGDNLYGELGINTNTSRSSPVQIATGVSIVTVNSLNTFYITTVNSLFSVGYNNFGILGNSSTVNRSNPVQIAGTWIDIAGERGNGSAMHAIKGDNTMWSWGANNVGQLGNNGTDNRSSPVQTGAANTWAKVGGGVNNGYGIRTDGTLWAWGGGNGGVIGDNTTTNKSNPIQIGADTTWTKVAGGDQQTYGLKSDGSLWTWGQRGYGLGGAIARSSPVQVPGSFSDISMNSFAAAITASSGLVIASVYSGALNPQIAGVDFGLYHSSTTQAYSFNGVGSISNPNPRSSPVQIGSATNWASVQFGYNTVFALKTDNTLWAWGNNDYGELHLNDKKYRSSPVQVAGSWTSVASNFNQTFLVKSDGTLWAAGYNLNYGNLGTSDTLNRSSPTQIGAATNWVSAIPLGQMSLATTTTKLLYTWGANGVGTLGSNTTVGRSSPVLVAGSWSMVVGMNNSMYGIKIDGTLWSWGYNSVGQLGINTTTNRSSPVQIGTGSWVKVSAGGVFDGVGLMPYNAIAEDSSHNLFVWGKNDLGQLNTGDALNRSSPVQVASGTSWTSISAGGSNFAILGTKI